MHGSHDCLGLCASGAFYRDADYNRLCVSAMPPLHGGKFEYILAGAFQYIYSFLYIGALWQGEIKWFFIDHYKYLQLSTGAPAKAQMKLK